MSAKFEQLKAHLTDGQDHRLWSLLVTVFGDLAADRTDWISGVLLNQITAAVGLKPEATRVALHRLRKDNWIENRRNGRQSDHRLTREGRAQTDAACPRIYATQDISAQCRLWIAAPGAQTQGQDDHTVWVSPDLALSTRHPAPEGIAACPLPDPLPLWMRDKVADPRVAKSLAETEAQFHLFISELDDGPPLSPFERMVLRILVVHTWRRIVLRLPVLPDAVFPANWPAARCRANAATLLARLPKPTLAQLQERQPAVVGQK